MNDWSCSGCEVHYGFYNYYNSLKESTRDHVLYLTKKYPEAKLIVTGISLGAAVAAIAAFDLTNFLKSQNHSVLVEAYTYGEPRIGNENYAVQINKVVPIYRVVNQLDPIPHLPPRQWGWYHPGS
jgi:predicted lipase